MATTFRLHPLATLAISGTSSHLAILRLGSKITPGELQNYSPIQSRVGHITLRPVRLQEFHQATDGTSRFDSLVLSFVVQSNVGCMWTQWHPLWCSYRLGLRPHSSGEQVEGRCDSVGDPFQLSTVRKVTMF